MSKQWHRGQGPLTCADGLGPRRWGDSLQGAPRGEGEVLGAAAHGGSGPGLLTGRVRAGCWPCDSGPLSAWTPDVRPSRRLVPLTPWLASPLSSAFCVSHSLPAAHRRPHDGASPSGFRLRPCEGSWGPLPYPSPPSPVPSLRNWFPVLRGSGWRCFPVSRLCHRKWEGRGRHYIQGTLASLPHCLSGLVDGEDGRWS